MRAVLKKELKSYAVSLTGAAALAIALLIAGFLTRYVNLYSGYASYAYTLRSLSFWFYAAFVPLLSMGTFSGEYQKKTDQLLFTAPVPQRAVVLGKYLACILLLLVPVLLMAAYALFLSRIAAFPTGMDLAAFGMFYLMGCAYFAVGIFFSALTENSFLSGIGTLLFIIATQLITSLETIVSSSSFAALLFLVILAAAAGILLYAATRRFYLSTGIAVGIIVVLMILFALHSSWFDGRIAKILTILDFRSRLDSAVMGTVDLRAVLFFAFYCIAGIELAIHAVSARLGSVSIYGTLEKGLLLMIFLFAGLLFGKIPTSHTVFDVTGRDLYSVGEETKETAAALNEDISIYYVTRYGEEDPDLEAVLAVYEGLSGRIHVRTVDMVSEPLFTRQFTEESVAADSIIVSSANRYKILTYEEFFPTASDGSTTLFDAEGLITGAIRYVTAENLMTLYCTTGHGEPAFDSGMMEIAAKQNLRIQSLQLEEEAIPAKDSVLVLFAPSEDFREEETEKILAYLEEGGSVLIVSLYSSREMPNFDRVLKFLGLERVPGYVIEADDSYYTQIPYLLLPSVLYGSPVTSGLSDGTLVCGFAQGIQVSASEKLLHAVPETLVDASDTGEVPDFFTPLLLTSGSSFAREDSSISSMEQQDTDTDGPFPLAVTVTSGSAAADNATTDSTNSSFKAVVYTTPCIFSSQILSQFLGSSVTLPSGNLTLFSNTLAYLTGIEGTAIPAKTMSVGHLMLSAQEISAYGIVMMFVIPGLILAAGIFIFVRRRSR